MLTATGAADYVAKYISKYGSGSTVASHVAHLIDDIICKQDPGHKMTIASLLSKAFVATAVPDTLCAGEAWHILWELRRTVQSRQCMPLNLDESKNAIQSPCGVEHLLNGTDENENHSDEGLDCAINPRADKSQFVLISIHAETIVKR